MSFAPACDEFMDGGGAAKHGHSWRARPRATRLADRRCGNHDDALFGFGDRESRLGRARMHGARSVGHDDPGMLAAARLLSAARRSIG